MNEFQATAVMVALFALRCVLPLALLVTIGYTMTRLANRWEAQEKTRPASGSAIRAVSRGEVFLYPSLAGRLVQDYLRRGPAGEGETPSDELTPREQEVLTLIAQGFSNNEIADRLVISAKTVDRHRENIMRKLNLHNRVDLVKYALRKGLIGLEE